MRSQMSPGDSADGISIDEILNGPPASDTPLYSVMRVMLAGYVRVGGAAPLPYPPIQIVTVEGARYALLGSRKLASLVENCIVEPDHVSIADWDRRARICAGHYWICAIDHAPALRLRYYRSLRRRAGERWIDDPRYDVQLVLTDDDRGWGSLDRGTERGQ